MPAVAGLAEGPRVHRAPFLSAEPLVLRAVVAHHAIGAGRQRQNQASPDQPFGQRLDERREPGFLDFARPQQHGRHADLLGVDPRVGRGDERRQIDDVERGRAEALDRGAEVMREQAIARVQIRADGADSSRAARGLADHFCARSSSADISPGDAIRSSGNVSLLNFTDT